MLSVKDINTRRFEQTRPGYKPEEVDDFLREIARDIERYQKDKEEAEKKIAVLVESVREYKKDEDALKDALIGAQKQGREVIANANEQADKIIADARAKAGEIVGTAKVQLEKEKRSLARMQQEVSDFKANLLNMYRQHLDQITAIPDYDDYEETPETPVQASAPSPEPEAKPDPVKPEAKPEAKEELQTKLFEQNGMENTKVMDSYKQEKAAFPFDNPVSSASKTESKFGELKFGQNK